MNLWRLGRLGGHEKIHEKSTAGARGFSLSLGRPSIFLDFEGNKTPWNLREGSLPGRPEPQNESGKAIRRVEPGPGKPGRAFTCIEDLWRIAQNQRYGPVVTGFAFGTGTSIAAFECLVLNQSGSAFNNERQIARD